MYVLFIFICAKRGKFIGRLSVHKVVEANTFFWPGRSSASSCEALMVSTAAITAFQQNMSFSIDFRLMFTEVSVWIHY